MKAHELELLHTFIQMHPLSAARELEVQSPEAAAALIAALPLTQSQRIFAHMLPPYSARICQRLPAQNAADRLADMDANHVTAILRYFPKDSRRSLLKHLPEKTAGLSRILLSYSDDTVGAWMKADILMFPSGITAGNALQRLADHHGAVDADALPVVDAQTYVLGLVELRALLRAKGDTPILHLVGDTAPTLLSRTSLVSACDHPGWREHDTLMVLNRKQQLVGLMRYVDLRRHLMTLNEQPLVVCQSSVLAEVGEAYSTSLTALLGLFTHSDDKGRQSPGGDL